MFELFVELRRKNIDFFALQDFTLNVKFTFRVVPRVRVNGVHIEIMWNRTINTLNVKFTFSVLNENFTFRFLNEIFTFSSRRQYL